MSVITLTSDFGSKDFAVASLKGKLLSLSQKHTIVDISHEIEPFHITEAAFILTNCYSSFPKDSIHIIAVSASVNPSEKPIVVYANGHYFITNNHGLLSIMFSEEEIATQIEIAIARDLYNVVEDVFAPIAIQLADGIAVQSFGTKLPKLKDVTNAKPIIRENELHGHIIYNDNYGNAISNISEKTFHELAQGRRFKIEARSNTFTTVHNHYSDIVDDFSQENASHGKSLALFNNHFLEIALYKSNCKTVGGASTLLGLKIGERIKVTFFDS